MPTYLTPSKFAELQKQYDPKTLEGMIERRGKDLYLKGEDAQTPQVDQTKDYDNAEVWQYLQGGDIKQNPYLPYLEPTVITKNGKRFLRIPRNQEMLTLSKYFDERGDAQYKNRSDFVQQYLKYRQDQTGNALNERKQSWTETMDEANYGLERAKTEYAVSKPYYKPGTDKKNSTSDKYKITRTDSGGMTFLKNDEPIGAYTYATEKGKTLMDVLKGSQDPGDKELLDSIDVLMKNGASYEEIISELEQEKPYLFD